MGVEYYSCKNCGETFPDVCDFEFCYACGDRWCSKECADEDGLIEDEDGEGTCKYCRKEDFTDSELLEYALKLIHKTKADIVAEYIAKKEG